VRDPWRGKSANVPVTDKLAVRAAAVFNRRDGYESFGLQADDSYAVRLSALYRPVDALSIYLWGSNYEQNGRPTAAQYLPLAKGRDPWSIPEIDPVTKRSNVSPRSRTDFDFTIVGYDMTLDLGGVEVDYLGSYARQTEQSLRKLIGNDQVIDNAQSQYVQNLRFSGDVGPVASVGGIDWFYARSRFDSQLGPNRLGSIFPIIKQRSIAGFAQGTYSVTDRLRVVAGARYTRDSLFLNGTNIRCFGPCVLPPVTFDDDFKHLDVKCGAEFDLAPRVLAYANVQTGYAPGTVNTVVANPATPPPGVNRAIDPQTLLAYTAGLKSTLGNGLLTLNLEGFYYRYRKLIIQSFVSALNQQTLFNAPRATVYGLQATSTIEVTDNDRITANVAYTHGRYGDFGRRRPHATSADCRWSIRPTGRPPSPMTAAST
jgi:iron complex outermembrane receptor protein